MAATVKLVCVGDVGVGKTCMLISHTTDKFPTEYLPTIFDNYQDTVMVDGQQISLGFWDTGGGDEESDRVRPLSYANANVFILCYCVVDSSTLEHVESKWLPEIRQHCPNSPFLLVGTKADLRKDKRALAKLQAKGFALIDLEHAKQKGRALGAARVLECSAKTQVGLKDVFDEAVRAALAGAGTPPRAKKSCALL